VDISVGRWTGAVGISSGGARLGVLVMSARADDGAMVLCLESSLLFFIDGGERVWFGLVVVFVCAAVGEVSLIVYCYPSLFLKQLEKN
jgi:hypothetical protein